MRNTSPAKLFFYQLAVQFNSSGTQLMLINREENLMISRSNHDGYTDGSLIADEVLKGRILRISF